MYHYDLTKQAEERDEQEINYQIEVGDIVMVIDGSFSCTLENFKLKMSHGYDLNEEPWAVIAVDCDLPNKEIDLDWSHFRNDTIIQSMRDNRICFTQARFLKSVTSTRKCTIND